MSEVEMSEKSKTVGEDIASHLKTFRELKDDSHLNTEQRKMWRDAFEAEAYLQEWKWKEIREGYERILAEEKAQASS